MADSDIRTYLLLTASIVIQSFSFLSLKVSTLVTSLWAVALVVLALLMMATRAVLWQMLLRRADLSGVYPYSSLVQVLIFFYAVVLFGESVKLNDFVGLSLMLSGAYFLTKEGGIE